MKRRILAGLLVLCMVLALGLTACSGGANAPATTTTAAEDDAAATTTSAAEGGEEATTAEEGGEATTAGEAAAPATWENLSWEKDTSPVTFSAYIDFDWYAVDTSTADRSLWQSLRRRYQVSGKFRCRKSGAGLR